MIKLFKYLKGRARVYAFLAPFLMVIEVIMDLLQPTILAEIINVGVANGDLNYVLKKGTLMLCTVIIGLAGGASCSFAAAYTGIHLGQDLREGVFTKIQTLSFVEIDRLKTSSLITRLTNDITQIQQLMIMGLKIAVRAPLISIGGIIMAFYLSRQLSVIFGIVIPAILVIVSIIAYLSLPLFKKMQEKIDKVNNVMRENLLGIRVVKAFNIETIQGRQFEKANTDLMKTSMKAQNITLTIMPIVMFLVNVSIVAILWYGGILTGKNLIEAGNIMAFVNYMVLIMTAVLMVVMIVFNYSRAKASSTRINQVLDTVPSIVSPQYPEEVKVWDVTFKDVSFKYFDEGEEVLSHISFHAKEGEKIGIIGSTGSGKSSLAALIPRLYDATKGEVCIGGKNVKTIDLRELRKHIGVVLQESILFSGTIEDSLRFGNEEASFEEIEAAAKEAQAYEFIMNKPEKYQDKIEQRARNLSGGQKQRLSIARTLAMNPKILIMDDASSALDLATEKKLQQAIKNRKQKATVFIIAQRISAIMDANQIIVLDQGKISGIGTHEQLLKNNEIYKSIAVSQLGKEKLGHES